MGDSVLDFLKNLGLAPEDVLGQPQEKNFSDMSDAASWQASQPQAQPQPAASAPPMSLAGAVPHAMVGATSVQGPDTLVTGNGPSQSQNSLDLSAFSPDAIQAAQEDARQRRLGTGVLGSISDAISTMTGTKPDSATWQALAEQANSPVTDLQQKQKALQGGISAQEAGLKLQNMQESNDPNSDRSKSFVSAAKSALSGYKQYGVDPEKMNGMSEAQATTFLQRLDPLFVARARMEQAKSLREESSTNKKSSADLKEITDAQKQLSTNKEYQKASSMEAEAQTARDNINAAIVNPAANNAVPIQLARLMSGGQRINQVEIEKLGGSKAISDRLTQAAKEMASGTLSEKNKNYMLGLVDIMEAGARRHRAEIAQDLSKQYIARPNHQGMSVNDAYRQIVGDDLEQPSTKAPSSTSGGSAQYSPDVMSYAQKYGISPDQAAAIKKKRMGQ